MNDYDDDGVTVDSDAAAAAAAADVDVAAAEGTENDTVINDGKKNLAPSACVFSLHTN